MDYKQMFDFEDLSTVRDAMFEAQVKDDMLAIMFEANKTTYFRIKTPNGMTDLEEIKNTIMQGDVLAPMLSINMVDKNIRLEAIKSHNVDTLGIAQCGFKGRKMSNFLNTSTNILGLQFGKLKCEKNAPWKKKRKW